ncbi:Hypp5379 [Branchiostoma lanceolatum]|uniref:Hypp5379 protein n=1 Tax=Branchiostoma lanceolatum TaxID=7740 RepID=A0A8K0AGK3_BRALA|nr:Hypp5379 [Branchiostoma lanceolatum]
MAHSSKIVVADYNINDLDADLEKDFEHYTFETIMGTISIDSRYLYHQVRTETFDPLKTKIKQDGVKKIQHFHLPNQHVSRVNPYNNKCTTDRSVYNDLVSDIVKHAVIGNIYAPYAESIENVRSLTNAIIKEAIGNVNIYFPNAVYDDAMEVDTLLSGCSEDVTIFLPHGWKQKMTEKSLRFVRFMDDERTSEVQRANSGDAVSLKLFHGLTSRYFGVTSLYSDTVNATNLFFQDHAYKFLHVRETIDMVNKIKGKRIREQSSLQDEPNIVIGILDSGLKTNHKAFGDRILAYKNFVRDSLPANSTREDEAMECQHDEGYDLTFDRNGHGTFCASIAAGDAFNCRLPDGTPPARENQWQIGVAPFAKIIYGKVASWNGDTNPRLLTEGIKWLLEFPDGTDKNVDIISLSLGFQTFDEELRKVILEANCRGKIIVCAASNDGRQQQTNIAFPARFGDVICVGSHSQNGQPSASSPIGREIDFMAPGENIWGASSAYVDGVIPKSGTSVATPFVAGIAAIVIKAAHHIGGEDLRRKVSNTAVMREILRKMASMPGHHDEAMGYGNLDPYRVFRYGEDFFKQIVDEIYCS